MHRVPAPTTLSGDALATEPPSGVQPVAWCPVPRPPDSADVPPMRVAIAHEWLVRYAGSERVVEQLLAAFPGARLVTTVVEPAALPADLRGAEPSFLNRVPGTHSHHEWFLGLMPLAWRVREPLDGVDVVITSSHACANAVRVAPGIPIVSYCHSPMRYAWDFEAEKERFPPVVRPAARLMMRGFRRWDRNNSSKITRFVANSHAVAGRINDCYGREAEVVHPPVRTDFFTPAGDRGDRFLYVGRLTGYKRPDLVVEAFRGLPIGLDVVGEGPLLGRLREGAGPNVRLLGAVDDERLRELYRSAQALVFPVDEDFGISMAEAQACGTPVIGLASGGALDIVEDGVTGCLIRHQNIDELRRAVQHVAGSSFSVDRIRERAERFSEDRFRREMQEIARSVVS
jgi:glycosyltransferase involved in cell wall biosynthesis